MRRYFLLTAVFLILGVFLLSSCAFWRKRPDPAEKELRNVLLKEMDRKGSFKSGDLIPIYAVRKVETAEYLAQVFQLAQNSLPMLVPEARRQLEAEWKDHRRYQLIRGPEDLKIRVYPQAQSFTLERVDHLYTAGDGNAKLSAQEGESLGREFIDKAGLLDLKENQTIAFDRIRYVRFAAQTKDGEASKEFVGNSIVVFHRVINDIPVFGPGSRVVVFFGDNRKPLGVQVHWRELEREPATRVPAVGSEKVIDGLIEGIKKQTGPLTKDLEITIERYDWGYLDGGRSSSQGYLQPAYAIQYIIKQRNSRYASTVFVAAAEKTLEPLHIVERAIPPEEKRDEYKPEREEEDAEEQAN